MGKVKPEEAMGNYSHLSLVLDETQCDQCCQMWECAHFNADVTNTQRYTFNVRCLCLPHFPDSF